MDYWIYAMFIMQVAARIVLWRPHRFYW